MHLELNNVSMLYRFLFGDTTIQNTQVARKATVNQTDKTRATGLKEQKTENSLNESNEYSHERMCQVLTYRYE
jgi:hypothetical protein